MDSKTKPYGIRGELFPSEVFKSFREEWTQDGIDFLVENSCIEISFDDENQSELGKEIADNYALAWSIKNGCPLKITYYLSWGPKDKGRLLKMNLRDEVGIRDRVIKVTTERGIFVVGTSDSISLKDNEQLMRKSLKDPILEKALRYYSEEVVEDKRPLYGVYKAIEAIIKSIGIERLANIAGVSKNYINDIKQTADTERHAKSFGKRKLTDTECKKRAKKLILAYADSIK